MSLFKYFGPVKDKANGKCSDASSIALSLSNKDKNGISREKLITISEELQDINNNNKTAKSNSKAVSKFKSDFPKHNESIIRPWVKKYKFELSSKKPQTSFTISIKRGRPTMLSNELDLKLRAMIVSLRTAGAVINIRVVRVFCWNSKINFRKI